MGDGLCLVMLQTDRAAERIKDLLAGKENIVGVRLGVKRRE